LGRGVEREPERGSAYFKIFLILWQRGRGYSRFLEKGIPIKQINFPSFIKGEKGDG